MRDETASLHVLVEKHYLDSIKMLCLRRGDLTMHVELALHFYLTEKRDYIEKIKELREKIDKS